MRPAVGSASRGCSGWRKRGLAAEVEWLRSLGISAFDYRETSAKEALADEIHVYFDNVGEQLQSARSVPPFGRVVACGAISRYNDAGPQPGPRTLGPIVTKRLRVEGFIILDHMSRFREFPQEVGPLVRDGSFSTGRRSSTGSIRPPTRAVPRRQRGQDGSCASARTKKL